MDEYISWALAAIGAVVGTLTATVATLWKVNESRNNMRIEELKQDVIECRSDRDAIRERADKQSEELAVLRARVYSLENRAEHE